MGPIYFRAASFDAFYTLKPDENSSTLEVVPMFCYLGDMLSAGGGCELAAITCCKCAWGKFRQLLPLLTKRHLPLLTRGKVYSSCVRSVMLHAAETWAMKEDTLNRLRRNDRVQCHDPLDLQCQLAQTPFSQCLASRTWMWLG